MKKSYLLGIIVVIIVVVSIFALKSISHKTKITPNSQSSMRMAKPTSPAGIIDQTQTVGIYKIMLYIGPQEQMYTKDEITSKHITSGEEMISGEMTIPTQGGIQPSPTNGSGMNMAQTDNPSPIVGKMQANGIVNNTAVKHLEVHVFDAKTGTVITNAAITISVVDTKTNSQIMLPIAVMQGIGQSISDLHYGNNISLENRQTYMVNVVINNQKATFNITI